MLIKVANDVSFSGEHGMDTPSCFRYVLEMWRMRSLDTNVTNVKTLLDDAVSDDIFISLSFFSLIVSNCNHVLERRHNFSLRKKIVFPFVNFFSLLKFNTPSFHLNLLACN